MILLSKEDMKWHIDSWFLRDMDAIANGTDRPDQIEIAENIAKAQLKKVVKYLKTCKGELVSKDGRPFVATFGMPVEDWQAICEEIK